ncbi:hypothetical protein BaRGS_00004493 [Batillaria attramentaria]|uniref:HMA domain-containing protein n=1 Tax=Batillaria attramentaria TaxID=370345 RepID=A0ABD0LYW1_9CAEN
MATPTKLEFAVQMTCQSCVDAVNSVLKDKPGVQSVDVMLDTGQVVVTTTLPSDSVKQMIESTGRLAALQGSGGSYTGQQGAAVAAMNIGSQEIKGVVRMIQASDDKCVFEGTVDGLPPGRHAKGMLEELQVGQNGRATFRFDNMDLKVPELIGRSVIIHKGTQPSLDTRLVCGIIARSAGLFQNTKRLCACDGVTIWEERNRPIAGVERSKPAQL